MSTKLFKILIMLLVLLAACVPQAELVKLRTEMPDLRQDAKTSKAQGGELQKRLDQNVQNVQDVEKRLALLDSDVKGAVDVQKVTADYGAKTDQLTTDIQLLQGKLEENNFRIAELSQKLDDKIYKITELSAKIDDLEAKVKLLSSGTSTITTAPTGTAADKDKRSAMQTIEPSDAYRLAKNDYDKGNFDLALAGFQNYVVKFPDTSQVDKAQYWVGECYYSKKDFVKAIEAFRKVITNYPKSDKVMGAKLKIGLSYINEKNPAKAKEYLNRVIKEYPGSNEAEIARDKLSKLGK